MSETLVVGAGMVGVCTALELQSRGHKVTLVDRTEPGTETSYGNAGIIMADMAEPFAMPRDWSTLLTFALGQSNDVKWSARGLLKLAPHLVRYFQNSSQARHAQISNVNAQLALHATDDHAPLIQASGSGSLISKDGFCEVYRDGRAFEAASKDTERLMSTYGVRARILEGKVFHAEEPAFLTTPEGAVHWQNCWSCNDPGGLTAAYSQLFSKRGGSILTGDAKTLKESSRCWQIETTSHSVIAEHVVIALGPWSAEFLTGFDYRVPMIPKRGYHMHFSAPRQPKRPFLDTQNGVLVSAMKKGLRLTSGVELVPQDAAANDVQLRHGVAGVKQLVELGERVSEPLWFGARPCMPDMLPMVGAAPRRKNMWFNFGHGHQGFTLGPTTARVLADAMDGMPSPLVEALSPSRRPH
ncbi:FAD-dependent oxidoreductase [Rhizobium leguminosarum bv. viciae]|nr:FAD-dependent oxidoreductase [Rhizobium leguminosarum bv. viciae]